MFELFMIGVTVAVLGPVVAATIWAQRR